MKSLFLYLVIVVLLQLEKTNQVILETSLKAERVLVKTHVNETYCTWFFQPPWKLRNDLFNDKPYNNSGIVITFPLLTLLLYWRKIDLAFILISFLVEYFGISHRDSINNESFIESSKINACNEINITFYSKVSQTSIDSRLHVLLHNQNKWDYIWNYMAVDTQWNYHQLSINLINQSEEYVRVSWQQQSFELN